MTARGVLNFLCLAAGVGFLGVGFVKDILWMILLGGVLLLIATGWFIYIRRHPAEPSHDHSYAASEGGFWAGVGDAVADGFRALF